MQTVSTATGRTFDDQQAVKRLLQPSLHELRRILRRLGAVTYDLWLPETRSLPRFIYPDERITGIVYGRYKQLGPNTIGRGALVATDRRILLIDKKPMFFRCDEISYRAISAITYSKVALSGTVTLHNRMGDITVRTFNDHCAQQFVKTIESHIFRDRTHAYYDDFASR